MCDMLLLGAAIQPVVPGTKVGYMASLDHSMWFHNPFRAHEWMLYEIYIVAVSFIAGGTWCTR
jgi:acyl-CoA thioesterase